jgi:hypothetical protein
MLLPARTYMTASRIWYILCTHITYVQAYYQDTKADGEVVDSGGDTDGEGGHADESVDSESVNDNNSGNDDD